MARDRFGIKPLYYSITKSGIVFASEIKAILEYPGIEGSPCYEAIGEYVKFQFVLGDRTFFKEVKKLEPAMTLECQASSPGSKDSGFLKLHRYWAPELEIDRGMTPEKVSTKLLLLLEDSVRLRMRSDVPVGVTLSGGLDSSILTLLASTLVDRPLETFTGYFDVSEKYDEREYSGGVADEARAIKNEILIDARDFVRALDHMAYILDEPVAGPGSIPQFLVNKKAREKVKVLLGGQGGDELFGGYARYLLLYLERAILAASGDTRLDEGISLESLSPGLGALSDYRPLMKSFFSDGVFGDIEERYLSLIDRSRGKLDIYTDEFLEQVKLEEAFLKAREIFRSINTESLFNRMTYFDFMTLLPALLTVDDRAGMAVSLETRAPYLDHRIVELVFRVPAKIKFSGGELKSLLREAAKQILPEKIRMRKDKKGFPVPVSEWLKEGPLLEFARERLLDGIAVNRGIFEPQKLEEHLSRENPYGRAVWGALSIELWFEKFIDR